MIAIASIFWGTKVLVMASPTGGLDTKTTYKVNRIMIMPSTFANRSIHFNESLLTKINIAIAALMMAPVSVDHPVNTFNPSPAPAKFPVLNASPPTTIKVVNK